MIPTNQEIALYNTFVSTITAAENRRQQTSSIFILVISAGYTVIGTIDTVNHYLLLILIIVVSIIWWRTIVYFRTLAKSKFKVIEQMEKSWEIRPFCDEYQHTKELNKKNIFPINLTFLEMGTPLMIIAVSLFILLCSINKDFLICVASS